MLCFETQHFGLTYFIATKQYNSARRTHIYLATHKRYAHALNAQVSGEYILQNTGEHDQELRQRSLQPYEPKSYCICAPAR